MSKKKTIYVEPNAKILNLVRKAINKYRTSRALSKELKIDESVISNWLGKRTRVNINCLLVICKMFNKNLNDILMNCKLYSQEARENEYIIFSEKLLNLAWQLAPIIKAEGHIEIKKSEIEVKQEKIGIDLLYEIKNKLEKFIPQKIEIRDVENNGKMYKELRFSCSVLKWILNHFFNVPFGYKCDIISAKAEIEFCKTNENMKYVLAKYLETDGTFFTSPKIAFGSLSKECVNDIYILMKGLGYLPRIYPKNDVACIFRLEKIIQCVYDILPYVVHKGRLNLFTTWVSNKNILFQLRIKNTKRIKYLIKKARNKIAKSPHKNVELAWYLSKMCGRKFNRKNVNHWLHGIRPPLRVVIEICNLLDENYFDYIPECYAVVLWMHNFISSKELEDIRRMNLSYQLSCIRKFNFTFDQIG